MNYRHHDIINAYMDGKTIQMVQNGSWRDMQKFNPESGFGYYFSNGQDYRTKPEVRKYRVAMLSGVSMTITADTDHQAKDIESWTTFVRWITDWVEYEV